MPNGKVGDHPYTDIVHYELDTYSPRAANLVREIAKLADEHTRRDLADLLMRDFNEYSNPDIPKLETMLEKMRDRLERDGRERGFEID